MATAKFWNGIGFHHQFKLSLQAVEEDEEEMQEETSRVAAAKEIHLCFNCDSFIKTWWHLYIIGEQKKDLLLTFFGKRNTVVYNSSPLGGNALLTLLFAPIG